METITELEFLAMKDLQTIKTPNRTSMVDTATEPLEDNSAECSPCRSVDGAKGGHHRAGIAVEVVTNGADPFLG